jgi:MFS family permease
MKTRTGAPRRWTVLVICSLSLFLVGLDTTIVNIGLPAIGAVWLLAVGYLLTGTGFGFANAPITNTAISGLPPAQAGFAGSITSTARQVGSALGIAIAGSLIASAAPAQLAQASRPGWLLVGACGLLVLLAAIPAPARQAPETTRGPSSSGRSSQRSSMDSCSAGSASSSRSQPGSVLPAPHQPHARPILVERRYLDVDQADGQGVGPHDIVGDVARVAPRPTGPGDPEHAVREDALGKPG